MRARAALVVVAAAAGMGALTGAFVLPDRGAATGPGPTVPSRSAPSAGSTRPSGSLQPTPSLTSGAGQSPTPSASATGPVLGTNMLSAADFAAVGLDLTAQDSDVRLELVSCTKQETLDAVAVSGPPVQRSWEGGAVVVDQQAITARDREEAAADTERVLRKLEGCQKDVPGHWVYGPTHTARLGPEITASWLGEVDGTLNTGGRAPKGEQVSGGIAVLRHGSRVSVLRLSWCASAGDEPACTVAPAGSYAQLVSLSRTAALRLG